MKKKILLPLLMATCLTACGNKTEPQENKIQHYAIYCDTHNGSFVGSDYTYCGCKDYQVMKKDLEGKNIVSIDCENVATSDRVHIHYVVVYTD